MNLERCFYRAIDLVYIVEFFLDKIRKSMYIICPKRPYDIACLCMLLSEQSLFGLFSCEKNRSICYKKLRLCHGAKGISMRLFSRHFNIFTQFTNICLRLLNYNNNVAVT